MAIRTVILDMGNVLVHFSHERMCRQIAQVCGIGAADVRRVLFDSGMQVAIETGRMSQAQVHARFENAAGRAVDFQALVHAASDIFERHTAIEPVVRSLKARGCRLVLLSNTSESHFRHLRRQCEVLGEFDEYVLSYQVAALKPQPAMFEAALAAAHCLSGECFYTDDIAEYVLAARRHGLDGEVFTTAAAFVEQLRQRGIDLPDAAMPQIGAV